MKSFIALALIFGIFSSTTYARGDNECSGKMALSDGSNGKWLYIKYLSKNVVEISIADEAGVSESKREFVVESRIVQRSDSFGGAMYGLDADLRIERDTEAGATSRTVGLKKNGYYLHAWMSCGRMTY